MELQATSSAPLSEIKIENENPKIEEEKQNSSTKKSNQSWKGKIRNGAKKRVLKIKNGIKSRVEKMVVKKIFKMGLEKVQKDFWLGVTLFKESADLSMKKLKRACIISSQMAQNGYKNSKEKMKILRSKVIEKAKAMKVKLLALKDKANLKKTKAKEDLKKLNAKMKGNAKKIGKKIKILGGKAKLKYAKAMKGVRFLKKNMKTKRVNFCIWFMYNCHTMKLMCLECWKIENPQIIMKNIKKSESSCAILIPSGYGAIIHKSLILTPYQYINDSKQALKGEVLIQFGDHKPHSPAASCIASNIEIERGFVFPTPKQQTNQSNLQSKNMTHAQAGNISKCMMSINELKLGSKNVSPNLKQRSKVGSPTSSKQGSRLGSPSNSKQNSKQGSRAGSPLNSKQGSRAGSPINSKPGTRVGSLASSNQCSRMGSRSASKTASKAGTPPSTPNKQHTHKLLPSRIFICNQALDLTLLACDPLPKSMVPLGLGQAYSGRNMDLYRRVYILGYKKKSDSTIGTLSIGMGRIIEMNNLLVKFGTITDNWCPGSVGFDERGNFAFIVCNPQNIKNNANDENLPSSSNLPKEIDQTQNSNGENLHNETKPQSLNTPTNSHLEHNGFTLSHRSAFGIRRYENEDYEFGPKFELKETIEHVGVVVQGIRQWISQHWEGVSFDKLIPPLGWKITSAESIPSEYDSHTNPKLVNQKWSNDYNKPPTYSEMALFMNVYNRLAALRRECSKSEREHKQFKHQRLSSITKEQQCLDEVAHGANLVNPGCSKFRRNHVVKREPPQNPLRKTSAAIRRALAHKRGHRDPPKLKRKSKKSCRGCM